MRKKKEKKERRRKIRSCFRNFCRPVNLAPADRTHHYPQKKRRRKGGDTGKRVEEREDRSPFDEIYYLSHRKGGRELRSST